MNGRDEGEAVLPGDETLADGPVVRPDDRGQRRALLDQRFVHGLLRALHTADATHREARVRAILERLDGASSRPRAVWMAAAVVLLSAAAALVLSWPGAPPRAEATVQRALDRLSRPVDRRWSVEVTLRSHRGREIRGRYALTVRPPRRFVLEGESPLGPVRAGCDGETVWLRPKLALLRWSGPYRPRRPLGTFLGEGRLDAGDLDLHELLARLHERAASVSVERVPPGPEGGEARVRIAATGVRNRRGEPLRAVTLEVGEQSGEVQRVEVVRRRGPRWEKRMVFESLGMARVDEGVYQRPW